MATAPKTVAPKSPAKTNVPSSTEDRRLTFPSAISHTQSKTSVVAKPSIVSNTTAVSKTSAMPKASFIPETDTPVKPNSMAPPSMKSMVPLGTKSIFITPRDRAMASRQPLIENLDAKDREEQEEWAEELIKRSGVCTEGYGWNRKPGGYQCRAGGHGITDEMLAEGMGGLWALPTED